MKPLLPALVFLLSALAPVAHAEQVKLTTPIAERHKTEGGITAHEYAYVGPPTTDFPGHVGGLSTSSDTYVCPDGQKNTGLAVVGNDPDSQNSGFAVLSGGGHQTEFSADVTNWSWYGKAFRVVGTCTDCWDNAAKPETY